MSCSSGISLCAEQEQEREKRESKRSGRAQGEATRKEVRKSEQESSGITKVGFTQCSHSWCLLHGPPPVPLQLEKSLEPWSIRLPKADARSTHPVGLMENERWRLGQLGGQVYQVGRSGLCLRKSGRPGLVKKKSR